MLGKAYKTTWGLDKMTRVSLSLILGSILSHENTTILNLTWCSKA